MEAAAGKGRAGTGLTLREDTEGNGAVMECQRTFLQPFSFFEKNLQRKLKNKYRKGIEKP